MQWHSDSEIGKASRSMKAARLPSQARADDVGDVLTADSRIGQRNNKKTLRTPTTSDTAVRV